MISGHQTLLGSLGLNSHLNMLVKTGLKLFDIVVQVE